MVTDYDCWHDDVAQHVTVQQVIERYGETLIQANDLLKRLLATPLPDIDEAYRRALATAVLTPDSALDADQLDLLAILRA